MEVASTGTALEEAFRNAPAEKGCKHDVLGRAMRADSIQCSGRQFGDGLFVHHGIASSVCLNRISSKSLSGIPNEVARMVCGLQESTGAEGAPT